MSKAMKAGLLSALVFPGVGQAYLGDWLRALTFFAPSLVSMWLLVDNVLGRAEAVTEAILAGRLQPELAAIARFMDTQLPPPPAELAYAGPVLIICWILSVADAVRMGRGQTPAV